MLREGEERLASLADLRQLQVTMKTCDSAPQALGKGEGEGELLFLQGL